MNKYKLDNFNITSKQKVELWIVNTKLNNFFKGILTIFNWG